MAWPQLEEKLLDIPASETQPVERSTEDVLGEILETVRSIYKRVDDSTALDREVSARYMKTSSSAEFRISPRDWLVPVILLTLQEKGDKLGYELMELVMDFGFEALNPGTLYRTLRQMETDGLMESTWKTSEDGPSRRNYSTTSAGKKYLESWVTSVLHKNCLNDTTYPVRAP
jgi:poly-beta-hydroxybutyrate-responsive repressor